MKIFIIAYALLFSFSFVHAQEMESNEVANIKSVVESYHKALEAKDVKKALNVLSTEILVQEGGHLEPAGEYRSRYLITDMQFSSAVPAEREVVEAVVNGNTGWVVSSSSMVGEYRGRTINSIRTELMVLINENGSWKIRNIHRSSRKNR